MTHKTPTMTMGFLVGLGVGAAAGMLLAPRKGEETRRQLQQAATHARDKVKQQLNRQRNKAGEAIDQAAETSEDVIATTQDKVNEAAAGSRTGRGRLSE